MPFGTKDDATLGKDPFRRDLRRGHPTSHQPSRHAVRPRRRGVGGRRSSTSRCSSGCCCASTPWRTSRWPTPTCTTSWGSGTPPGPGAPCSCSATTSAAVRRRPLRAVPYRLGRRPARPRSRGRQPGGARRAAAPRALAHDGQPVVPAPDRPDSARHQRTGRRAVPRAGRGRHGAPEPPRRRATGDATSTPCGQCRPTSASLDDTEAGLMIDLLQSYLSVAAYGDAVELVAAMPAVIRRTSQIREKHAFALNRLGRRGEGRRHPEAVDRRARPGQRDLRPARPGLQGPVGRGGPGRPTPARRRAAPQGHRGLPDGIRGRLARPLPGHQRGAADAPARPGRYPDRRGAPRGALQRAAEGAAAPCRLLGPRHPPRAAP